MSCINCADSSPRFCTVCGREVGQLWSWARAGCYETLCVCTDQEVSARMVCKLRHTIGSCCSTRNLPPILQEILLRPELAESIARLLEFGPREIACAFRNMLQIPCVRMPLPSPVTDCILSFLRTDFTWVVWWIKTELKCVCSSAEENIDKLGKSGETEKT